MKSFPRVKLTFVEALNKLQNGYCIIDGHNQVWGLTDTGFLGGYWGGTMAGPKTDLSDAYLDSCVLMKGTREECDKLFMELSIAHRRVSDKVDWSVQITGKGE